jgi:hypothetical protein
MTVFEWGVVGLLAMLMAYIVVAAIVDLARRR